MTHRIASEAAQSLVERLNTAEVHIGRTRDMLVSTLRTDGWTWGEIGELFGVSRQAAHGRWNTKETQ